MRQNLGRWPWEIRSFNIAAVAVAALAACSRGGADLRQADAARPAAAQEAGYVRPPQLLVAERRPDGEVFLSGRADPQDRVRLSAPGGEAYGATADDNGRWTIALPGAADLRLFGLSEVLAGRLVQSEGYIALPPASGQAAVVLRAGVGALALGGSPDRPRIVAIDCDAAGGAVISGLARPGSTLHLSIDDGAGVDARADGDGRYSIALGAAMRAGDHEATVSVGADSAQVRFAIGAPPTFTGLPFRGQRQADRWRIDWITPGGGVQTTYVMD
jgi:hypothetical protein